MIRLDLEQGSPEWAAARLGIPTASRFSRILTDRTAKPSAQAEGYARELLAEQLLGVPVDHVSSGFMTRGTALESEAVGYYELTTGRDTAPGGFVLRDDRRVGCSPDRFVGDHGLLQIKVPSAAVHIAYLLDEQGIGYRAQVQGELWITGRQWSDTLSYHPELPAALVRQARDEEFIAKLDEAMTAFLAGLDEMRATLRARYGLFQYAALMDAAEEEAR